MAWQYAYISATLCAINKRVLLVVRLISRIDLKGTTTRYVCSAVCRNMTSTMSMHGDKNDVT